MKLTLKTSFAELDLEFTREVGGIPPQRGGSRLGHRQDTYVQIHAVGTDKYYFGVATHNPVDLYSEEIGEKKALADAINSGLSEEFNLTKSQRKEVWDQYFRERAAYKLDAAVAEYSKYFRETAAPTPKEEPQVETVDPNDPYFRHGGYKKAAAKFLASDYSNNWYIPSNNLSKEFRSCEYWICSISLDPIMAGVNYIGSKEMKYGRIKLLKIPF